MEKKPIIVFDDDITDEIQYRIDNKEDFGFEKDEEVDEEKLANSIYEDTLFWQDRYDFVLECLTEKMEETSKKYSYKDYWKAEVQGFGWQNLDGNTEIFKAENGRELLEKILPDCDCHFQIYKTRTGFEIKNFHHDSPTGEMYYIKHATKKEIDDSFWID